MDLDEAMALSDEELVKLPLDEKLTQAENTWKLMGDEDKDIAVFFSALAILEGVADLDVAAKIFEMADEDGIDTPPSWREMINDLKADLA